MDKPKNMVVGLGQCSLDILGSLGQYPPVDSKCDLDKVLIQGGGPVATALVTLARLGVPGVFLGCVGDDDFGRRIARGLEREKVDCRHLLVESGASSQFSFVAVEQDGGRRTIFCHRGSCRPLIEDDLPAEMICSSRLLHLDGSHPAAALAAARLARANGVITVLDGGSWRPGIEELLPLIDHLVVSGRFAEHWVPGRPVQEILPVLLGFGCQAATVTNGEAGSHTQSRDGESFHLPAFSVKSVDTTGCGDVFHGGYLFGLLQNWSLLRTVRFSAACAAIKSTALGGRTAIPTLLAVEDFLSR
ncbi:PfkB family carbohydrate kinase [Syntrophotalea acetylenivorans]|nr:PfkB family carbohydrate kinase [Syntrophotalea acetylenivorans]